jgi:hypothetical protein
MQYSESRDELKIFFSKNENENRKAFYDFDNTLFLDNSTNLYFNTIRPRWLIYIVFYILNIIFDKFKIDRFVWEDYVKTVIGVYLFPISYLRWKYSTAKFFAKELRNEELLHKNFKKNRKFVVISFGHKEIIEPILKYMEIEYELVSSRVLLSPKNIRIKGKLFYIERYLEQGDKENCLFVTDSKDDDELLEFFENSFLLVWRKQTPVNFHNVYLPLKYTAKCKYNVKNIIWNQHIGEDYVVLLLAFGLYVPLDIFALFMLFISFFAVYEMGYYENDFRASKNEEAPSLSGKQKEYIDYPIYRCGLVWVFITSIIGVFHFSNDVLHDYTLWLLILLALFLTFRLFNNVNVRLRIYIFPFLQIFKTFSYTLFLKLNPIGMMLLFSQVMRQSTNYHVYRSNGDIRSFKRQNHRLLIFVMLLVTFMVSEFIFLKDLISIQFFIILLWLIQRSITRDMGGYKIFFRNIILVPRIVLKKIQGK